MYTCFSCIHYVLQNLYVICVGTCTYIFLTCTHVCMYALVCLYCVSLLVNEKNPYILCQHIYPHTHTYIHTHIHTNWACFMFFYFSFSLFLNTHFVYFLFFFLSLFLWKFIVWLVNFHFLCVWLFLFFSTAIYCIFC